MHETGHQWVHGIFGNNEWREGWLDEGFSSFLTNWYNEEKGAPPSLWDRSMEGMREMELAGATQPISLESAEFRDPRTYSAMTYTKPSLVYRMLRYLVGEDVFRQALHDYYETKALEHVTEADLRASFRRASGLNLDWFFEQWIHTTDTLDYAIAKAETWQVDDVWVARVEVTREGDAYMPVDLRVGGETRRLEKRDADQVVYFRLNARPAEAVLDPNNVLIDVDISNNRASF